MGLDILAVEKLGERLALEDGDESVAARDDVVFAFANADFKERADDVVDGAYVIAGQRHEFAAGSYSRYNTWREQLALVTGRTIQEICTDRKPGPFVELIAFADDEGIIGPKTSAKLAADFVEWKSRAEAHAATFESKDEARYFLERYAEWSRAFHLAKNGGVVVFQ